MGQTNEKRQLGVWEGPLLVGGLVVGTLVAMGWALLGPVPKK